MLRRPWRLAMAQTARQKCTKLQQPTSWRACRKKRLPNGGNFPILGIGSFLHTPALRPGRFFTVMEGKTLHFGNPQATPAEKPLQFETDLLRMYQKWNCLDGMPAGRCPRCGG